MSRRIPLWPAITILAVAVTAYTFMATGPNVGNARADSNQDPVNAVVRPSRDKIHAGALWPQLRWYLKALGNRLEEPGKERLTLGGMLERAGEQPVPFAAISEFPDRLQFTTQSGLQARTITYDGKAAHVVGGVLSTTDQGLIESLVNDTAEHFFAVQLQGTPTRHLGNRFRADDGSTENYAGPFYDIFSMLESVTAESVTRSQPKFYYFNSETHLLESVKYQISRNGQTIDVETAFSSWQRVQDQQVAHRIVRSENGQPLLSLTITSATIGPLLKDGVF